MTPADAVLTNADELRAIVGGAPLVSHLVEID
jgi:hypothetical protein